MSQALAICEGYAAHHDIACGQHGLMIITAKITKIKTCC